MPDSSRGPLTETGRQDRSLDTKTREKNPVVTKTLTLSYILQNFFWSCQVHGLSRANGKVSVVESPGLLTLLIKSDGVRAWVGLNLKVKVKWHQQL